MDFDVSVTMRDGVRLSADVYRPSEGRWPVLVQRTPYGKEFGSGLLTQLDPVVAARSGYVAVVQDVRGRGRSHGTMAPFDEGMDGYDTIEWAAVQPWSNGRVGLFGGSYMAATQLQAAAEGPPALHAAAPMLASSDYYEGRTYRGGALELASVLSSSLTAMAGSSLRRLDRPSIESRADKNELREMLRKLSEVPPPFPLRPFLDRQVIRDLVPWLLEWIEHDQPTDYWTRLSLEHRYDQIDLPMLHVTSWFDQFHVGTLRNYEGLRRGAGSAAARDGQYLVVGPWNHYVPRTGALGSAQVGELHFGPDAILNLDAMQLGWFDRWLKGHDGAYRQRRRVRLFVMGLNQWRDEDEWPLRRAEAVPFHLRGGSLPGAGDGALNLEVPRDEPPDEYVHNPLDPVPTRGGAHLAQAPVLQGPVDQSEIENRADVLVYSTAPLDHALEVTGWVEAHIWIVSSAASLDVVVRLTDVHPDGRSYNVCDGITRVRAVPSGRQPLPVRVRLGATSQVFGAGHRVRVQICSSDYPRHDVNPGTGERALDASSPIPSHQRVFHDSEHRSCVWLPIVSSVGATASRD